MDATIYSLDAMRSKRNSRMFTERLFQMPLASDGLGLIVAATCFWVQYGANMASYHHKVMSAAFSPYSK